MAHIYLYEHVCMMNMYILICMYCTVMLLYCTVMLCYVMLCYVYAHVCIYIYVCMNILNGVYKPTYKNKHHLTWNSTMTAGLRSTHGVDTCVLANESLVVIAYDPQDGAQLPSGYD